VAGAEWQMEPSRDSPEGRNLSPGPGLDFPLVSRSESEPINSVKHSEAPLKGQYIFFHSQTHCIYIYSLVERRRDDVLSDMDYK